MKRLTRSQQQRRDKWIITLVLVGMGIAGAVMAWAYWGLR